MHEEMSLLEDRVKKLNSNLRRAIALLDRHGIEWEEEGIEI
jgi:hypothetical protein